jgi:hypothetical protein
MSIIEAIQEFKSFALPNLEEIFTKDEWKGDWYSKNAILLICAEYCCDDENEEKRCNINYDTKHCGSERFRQWLKKYNLCYEWYNSCIAYVYKN